ncbi:MAG: sulfurtransferase-like selenium metabolism protein YedF [Synergistaceae bacterium]|jgi:selenium metabolism protein YedF|nr:sulfurtransferase-like selenium metabolism protein YedF [Synergistaceae bacterium]
MKTINARGKLCPEPVVMTKAVVDQGERELEVLLDNPTAASNVMRFLESREYSVLLKDDEGMLSISACKKEGKEGKSAAPAATATETSQEQPVRAQPATKIAPGGTDPLPTGTFSVLVTCKTLGRSDEQLGEVLMKSFLGTLAQMDNAPIVVALMNEGVRLSLYDSSTCDHLKNLEKKGVIILVCGTCVSHFAIADRIGVGTISNMFEIIETLNRADKTITL